MKIEVDMTRVGEPTHKMWEFVWKIEGLLNIKYKGPEDFKAVSKWIDKHSDAYLEAFILKGIEHEFDFDCNDRWDDYKFY